MGSLKFWIRFSLINLFIVAFFGVLMRYKIGFSFPYLDQKNLQHAHSHFAFAGWITHTLFVLILYCSSFIKTVALRKYYYLLFANLVTAYGMLISFSIQGYGTFSIIFSTTSIFLSLIFGIFYFIDSKGELRSNQSILWFKAGLGLALISSLGTFVLAYMMATKTLQLNWYLGSVYFYLHFQYNGWFFFAILGFIYYQLQQFFPDIVFPKKIFQFFVISCFPAFLLSVLWIKLPVWLYSFAVFGAVVQFIAWILFLFFLWKYIPELKKKMTVFTLRLFLVVGLAISIKFILQLGSTHPEISKLAFGFRPIVIAYLHLVLLVIISLFLINFLLVTELIQFTDLTKKGIFIFVSGVLLNECLLALQGILSFSYTVIPYINEMLFGASLLLLSGIMLFMISCFQKRRLFL